jgi:anti-sigma factor RsiW
MSERSLSEAEFDLLADYTAGVLEAREASEVEALIAHDPIWGGTHAALIEADAPVRAALAAQVDEPMPADVADRITAALAGLPNLTPRSTVVSLEAARERRRPTRRFLAVAAAIVGIVGGIGFASSYLSLGASNTGSGTSVPAMGPGADRGGSVAAEDAGALPNAGTSIRILTSGANYNANTLAQIVPPLSVAGPPAFSSSGGAKVDAPAAVPDGVRQGAPPGLTRLTDPAALTECLAAIVRVFPGVVTYAEYARFESAPALIVIIDRVTGSTIVAVGPDCGRTGPDQKAYVLVP